MTTETLATGSESTFLYRFLVSPDLRWMRYLVLILVLGTISFNQVFMAQSETLGDCVKILIFAS